MNADERKTYKDFEFLVNDPKWKGSARIVEREVNYDGRNRIYVDIVLYVGKHYLTIPWSGIVEIKNALESAHVEAEQRRKELRPNNRR